MALIAKVRKQKNWIQNEMDFDFLNEKLLLPGEKKTDGFYYAVFRKADAVDG